MKEDGELIDYVNGELVRLKTPPKVNDVYEVSADADHFKLLLLSDTHLHERPQILQTGHMHQSFYMKQDDTRCFQTSCLEDLTPYSKSQGFANDKSVWWVDVALDKRGKITHLTQELETFGAKRLVKRK